MQASVCASDLTIHTLISQISVCARACVYVCVRARAFAGERVRVTSDKSYPNHSDFCARACVCVCVCACARAFAGEHMYVPHPTVHTLIIQICDVCEYVCQIWQFVP